MPAPLPYTYVSWVGTTLDDGLGPQVYALAGDNKPVEAYAAEPASGLCDGAGNLYMGRGRSCRPGCIAETPVSRTMSIHYQPALTHECLFIFADCVESR